MSMRGLSTPITFLRREVFKHVAKAAFEDWTIDEIDQIPHEIITGDTPTYRESIDREKRIIRSRVRMAMNIDLDDETSSDYKQHVDLDALKTKVVSKELMSVIPSACEACPEKSYFVSNSCHGCLAHPCVSVCPVGATSFENGHSFIDQTKCIKCGKCYDVCPYGSINKNERPCNAACGVNAFTKDEHDRAVIVSDKCVACGMCMVSCPFGAIMDHSEIYQLSNELKNNQHISAIIAPAFVGQFGDKVKPEQVLVGLYKLGFSDIKEVALGADITAVEEAKEYVENVPEKQPYMITSCCPAYKTLAFQELKDHPEYVSNAYSPMIEAAKIVRSRNPETKVVFIGPCSAKKLEAAHHNVPEYVDYVLTFEETNAMFEARDIDLSTLTTDMVLNDASLDGRGFAVSGGVLAAVNHCIQQLDPNKDIKVEKAESLANCKKMLMLAKAGKFPGYLLEGMACPGGCIGGAGTLINQAKAAGKVKLFSTQSEMKSAFEAVEKIEQH